MAGSGTRSTGTGTEAQAGLTVAIITAAANRNNDLDMDAPTRQRPSSEAPKEPLALRSKQESFQRLDRGFVQGSLESGEKVSPRRDKRLVPWPLRFLMRSFGF